MNGKMHDWCNQESEPSCMTASARSLAWGPVPDVLPPATPCQFTNLCKGQDLNLGQESVDQFPPAWQLQTCLPTSSNFRATQVAFKGSGVLGPWG